MPESLANIKRHLEKLSLRDLSLRREALSEILYSEGVKFSREEENDIMNFAFASEGGNSGLIFAAHYDNFRGSFGANDNMASVCILIDLWRALMMRNIHADFLLTDGEENGHSGAEFYARTHDLKKYTGIINLDLCGYGDVIVLNGKLKKFTARSLIKRHNAEVVKYLPEDDAIIFRKSHVPTLSVAIVPKWDVQYLKALASFGEGILGRPPEFYMIISQMEITQTFHNGPKDTPEFVDEAAMLKVYEYLLDGITTDDEEDEFSFMRLFKRWRRALATGEGRKVFHS
ncbi:MAG: M28 family peptidase [Synergistaceae bacterium]|nr:M28 family peptidase [Synergistaceae bacterium]